MQILEDGILTDAQGRRVDFKNTVIIMTSNVGARMITEHRKLGFAVATQKDAAENQKQIREDVLGELKKTFRPEFLNRVDDIIVFQQLSEEDIRRIARRMLQSLDKRLEDMGMTLEVSDDAVAEIAKEGFDPVYGARPLRRAIQSRIEDVLAEQLLEGRFRSGDVVQVGVKDNRFSFDAQPVPAESKAQRKTRPYGSSIRPRFQVFGDTALGAESGESYMCQTKFSTARSRAM